MLVCEMELGDFIVCTFPNDMPTLFMQRIEIDVDFMTQCIIKSGGFYKAAIMPELLGNFSLTLYTQNGGDKLRGASKCNYHAP